MSRKYSKPPIVEAVCEFRLTQESKWDLTIPGLIYEEVRKEFPNKEKRQIQELRFSPSQQGVQQPETLTSELVQFYTNDRKTYIQVGHNLLSVSCLKPYPKWDGFKPRIKNAFRALIKIVDVIGLERVGLRYINRIEIPSQSVNLGDYFEFLPSTGEKLPKDATDFILGCVFPFFNGRDLCKVQLTRAVPENPVSVAFLLDLDYYLAQPRSVSASQALEWVEEAHQHVEDIFEGCIKQPLREIFVEEK